MSIKMELADRAICKAYSHYTPSNQKLCICKTIDSKKVWDVTQPKDAWERGYARLEWLRIDIKRVGAKVIEVDAEEEPDYSEAFENFLGMDIQASLDKLTIRRTDFYER